MAVIVPTLDELFQGAWQRVSAATGLTDDSESSISAAIVRITASYIQDLWIALANTEARGNVSTATGTDLDKIGTFLGITRLQAQAATTQGIAPSVYFLNNSLVSVTVPQGTRIWTPDDVNRAFLTQSTIAVPAGQRGFVDITAATPGAYYNVGANALTASNFGNPNVTVNNLIPINSGANIESDSNYRARIIASVALREGPNLIAVRNALLEIPGIRDVSIQNLARGTGTFDALILSWDRDVPDSVLLQAQQVLDEMVALGVSAIAKAPVLHYIDINAKLTVAPGVDPTQARASANLAINGYVNNLPIESGIGDGTLYYDQLLSRVELSNPDILTVQVTLIVDDSPVLKSDQTTLSGERFVSRVITVT